MSKTTNSTVSIDKATPRPWFTGDDDPCVCAMIENPKISGGWESLRLATMETALGQHGRAQANASLIVRAVNRDDVFDELVEVVRDLLSMAESVHEVPPTRANRARAILAKATEGKYR